MAKKVLIDKQIGKLKYKYSVFIPVFTFALTKKVQTKGTAREIRVVLCLLRGMIRGNVQAVINNTAPHSLILLILDLYRLGWPALVLF